MNLDQGQPGFPAHVIEEHLRAVDVPYRMLRQDTYSIVKRLVPEGKATCPVCSRLRRGILYNAAVELGCNRIALGHHRDDLIETLLLSALYAGSLKSMPPKLRSDDGREPRHPAHVLRGRGGHRRLRRGAEVPGGALRPVRLAAEPAPPAGEGAPGRALGRAPGGEGKPPQRARQGRPDHLLDLGLLARLGEAHGANPWVDAEEDGGCASTPEALVGLGATSTRRVGSR